MPNESMNQTIAALYDRHVATVYRVCLSMMGNAPDAEDAVQAVFIKLMNRCPSFADAEHEKAWLIATARNHCRDQHRRWWSRKVVRINPLEHDAASHDVYDTGELTATIRQLPAALRLVLYLFYYEGYKVNEIADMLRLNPNTVKTQLRTARHKLKMNLEDERDE